MTRQILSVVLWLWTPPAVAQQLRFDDVIRNLRNPDPKVRLAAVQVLRESKYPEAIGPIAPLVNDPVDQIQLEAIAA
jgi:HEAT repeat protein